MTVELKFASDEEALLHQGIKQLQEAFFADKPAIIQAESVSLQGESYFSEAIYEPKSHNAWLGLPTQQGVRYITTLHLC